MLSEDEIVGRARAFVAALNSGDRAAANNNAFDLIDARAPMGAKWRSIATVLQTNGEVAAARQAMALYVEQSGGSPQARFEQAAVLAQTGGLSEAWEIMATVPRNVPDPAGHEFILGSISVNLGDVEEAQRHLLAAIDHNPRLGQAILALAASTKMTADQPIGDRILAAADVIESAEPLERAHYHYAAGRVHFDRRQAAEAFAHFRRGADLVRGWRPYDPEEDRRSALECRRGYTRDFIDRVRATIDVDTSRSIFVTGLPRSGTTLVEQILVSHSAVVGGEELGRFPIIQRDLTGFSAEALATYMDKKPAADLSRLYLHLIAERFGDEGRIVDKSLNSSRYMGLIASVLPQAKVIWMRRDPLDCAWSAYRTYFLKGLDWSWRLEDIAAHFKLEDELFDHWTALLPDVILPVRYEDLVSDPEPNIRRILDFVGLPEEPGVFKPQETRRVVSTASVMQVREPINTRAIDAAGPYREFLKPFLDAYEGVATDS